jgi:hypothetical protein
VFTVRRATAKGIQVSRKRIARLMSRAGLAGVCRRKFVVTTVKGDNCQVYKSALDLSDMSDAMNDQTADRWSLGMWPTSSPASLTPRFAASDFLPIVKRKSSQG